MTEVGGLVLGLHHITNVTANQAVNQRFYTEVLGLRRVKLTVNQDDIYHRHLFYADERGTTGSAITFFEWPQLPDGRVGLYAPHHLSYAVPNLEALPRWRAWLLSQRVSVVGPLVRDERVSIYLRDPDGLIVELTSLNNEGIALENIRDMEKGIVPPKTVLPEMRLTTFNHASPLTSDPKLLAVFFDKLLGLKNSFTRPNPDQNGTSIVGIGNSERPDFFRYLAIPEASDGYVGRGSIHHIAMAVEDEDGQRRILRRLNEAGIRNSGVIDRLWFKSLYFRDPEGNLLEVATKGPGYARDESPDKLGTSLVLPPWLEKDRSTIEKALKKTDQKNDGNWPPDYLPVASAPESLSIT